MCGDHYALCINLTHPESVFRTMNRYTASSVTAFASPGKLTLGRQSPSHVARSETIPALGRRLPFSTSVWGVKPTVLLTAGVDRGMFASVVPIRGGDRQRFGVPPFIRLSRL
jgi:hypothetical protein